MQWTQPLADLPTTVESMALLKGYAWYDKLHHTIAETYHPMESSGYESPARYGSPMAVERSFDGIMYADV